MANQRDRDTGLEPLVILIVLVVLGLLLLLFLQGIGGCPQGLEECSSDISECGCCERDPLTGGLIESCGWVGCANDANYFMSSGKCCKRNDPSTCLDPNEICVNPTEGTCGIETPCCPDYSCDGGDCRPCEEGLLCGSDNPCCAGMACNTQGRCQSLACAGMECPTLGAKCQICDSEGSCMDCIDDSVCIFDSRAGRKACTSRGNCPEGYYACDRPDCPGGCCNAITGDCASCAGMACTADQLNSICSICDAGGVCVECTNVACVNVGGAGQPIYSCRDGGDCGEGFYACDDCPTGCCDASTGECAGCAGQVCSQALYESGQPCCFRQAGNVCLISCDNTVCGKVTEQGTDSYVCFNSGGCPPGTYSDPSCPGGCRNADGTCPGTIGGTEESEICIELTGPIIPPGLFGGTFTGGQGGTGLSIGSGSSLVLQPPVNLGIMVPGGGTSQLDSGGMMFMPDMVCETTVETEKVLEGIDSKYVACRKKDEEKWKVMTKESLNCYLQFPDIPDWVYEEPRTEVCLDCLFECDPSGAVYDLNGDGFLDIADLDLFDQFADRGEYDRRFDFNHDGIVDALDRLCIVDVCEDGTCRVVNVSAVKMCLNSKVMSAEERFLLGSQIKDEVSRPFSFTTASQASPYSLYRDQFIGLDSAVIEELGMASGSPHITVFRGDPWLEGSGGTFNKRYFSGCVYFSSPDGLKRIKLMELARGQSCSEGLSISVTDSLASLLDEGKKEHLEMCVKTSCIENIERQPGGVRMWAQLASVLECHADRNLINDLNNPPLPGTPDDELLSVCITNVEKGVDELMDALIFECGILNERGVICLDDYAGCTTDAAISRRCGTIAGYADTTCNNWKNIGKIDPHINCNVIQARVKNECTSSYRKCITEADQFNNLAFNLIRDLSIGLLDAVTMRGEIQTGSDYSIQSMENLPMIISGAGECPYHTGIGAAADSKIRDCIRTTCSSILYDSSTLNSILPSGLQKDWKYELVGLLSSKCSQMSQLLLDDYKRRGECRSYGEAADVLCAQLLSEGYTGQDYSFTEESMGDCRDILTRVGRIACDKVNEGQC